MGLELIAREPRNYTYVCTPTRNELPDMVAFWSTLEGILGQPIVRVYAPLGLREQILFFKTLPNNKMRWCTRLLKIKPYQAWLSDKTPATSYVGLRADEDRIGVVYDECSGITQDYPMKRWGWTIETVTGYLRDRGIKIPKRGDCAWCYDQRLGEWFALWRDHREIFLEGEDLETITGHTFRSAQRDTWPAALKDLRSLFEKGVIPKGAAEQDLDFSEPYERCRVCRL